MKNRRNIFILCGVILIIVGAYFLINKTETEENIKIDYNLEKFANDKYIFVNNEIENSFIYLYITKESEGYALNVKSRKYYKEDNFLKNDNSGFKYLVEEKNQTLINEDKEIEAEFKDSSFVLKSKGDYVYFNGTYKYVPNLDKEYEIPKFEKASFGGLYEANGDKTASFYISDFQDGYLDIQGYVTNTETKDYYIFLENDIDTRTNTMADNKNKYKFSFTDNSVSIKAYDLINESEVEHVLNGEYKKINKIAYKDLIKDLEEKNNYSIDVQGEY